ncbi:hypothetical protein HWV62_38600 [Athelia sp. TMB]|nr:hypothetical protein HWV62_38600 [Athelia sp. TMB]
MTHGKGRDFKKLPPITPENAKDGHLELLLLEAERAWAYSQELSTAALQPSNEERASTLRHSATGRFRRAVNWSTQLLSLCQSLHGSGRLSAAGLLQATTYTLILNGRFLRHRDDVEDALVQLSVAKGLLDELAGRAGTSRDQALATLWGDEIAPEIRYCAHEMGREKAYDVDGIVKEISGKNRGQLVEGYDGLVASLKKEGETSGTTEGRKRLGALEWEGQPVPVRNPELVDVLLKVQDAKARLGVADEDKGGKKEGKTSISKKGVAAYDAILLALSDAEEVARKLVEAQQLSGASTASSAAGTRDIHFVHAYIVYQLLSRRIQRDLLLISTLLSSESSPNPRSTQKPKPSIKAKEPGVDARLYPAVVKLLETILQSLGQMRNLSIVDESPDLAAAVEARLSFTKARRCFYLARCYAPVKKYAEALTLIQHANIHVREARSVLSTADSDPINFGGSSSFYLLNAEDFDTFDASLASDALSFKNDWFGYNGGQEGVDPKTYKKPLFFDIALNYVQLDMERLEERSGKAPSKAPAVKVEPKAITRAKVEEQERAATPEPPQAASSGGISSLLGGWWGRK